MVDDKFFAWLDGELSGPEAVEMEAQIAADPALQALAGEHRALGARLHSAFDPIAAQPVSLAAYAPAAEHANVPSFVRSRVARQGLLTQRFWAQAASIALVFAMGALVGTYLFTDPASPVATEAGRLVAAGPLEAALYKQLASQPAESGPRIGLTFRDQEGKLCRTFTDQTASGLACHQGGDWRMEAVFQAPEGQSAEYRMAAGADPRLSALVESSIAGEPFDAAQEGKARDSGWK